MNNQLFIEKYGLYNRKIDKYTQKSKTLYSQAEKALNNKKIEKYDDFKERLVSKYLLKKKYGIAQLEGFFGMSNKVNILPSKLLSNSKKVLRVVMEPLFKQGYGKYTKDKVKYWGSFLSKKLKELKVKGTIQTVLNFGGMVRSGANTIISQDINIYNPDDYYENEANEHEKQLMKNDKFKEIVFFVTIDNTNANFGGSSNNNDCFWFCLNNGVSQYNPWEKPEDLKKFLGLERNDLVGLMHIEKIENKIGKVGINISGDCNYISRLGLSKNLNLVLRNNHYQINHNLNRKVHYISFTEKQILLFDKKKSVGYDGNSEFFVNPKQYNEIMNFKTNFLMVPRNTNKPIDVEYNEYLKLADELKLKSNGIINLYKTGTIKKSALKLLDDTTKHITPEIIEFDEACVLENSTSNGFIFSEPYEGIAHKGDITSLYPSIYSSKNVLVPVKRGIFKVISNENIIEMTSKLNGNYAYGLYRFNIYPSGNPKIDRLFRFKPIDNFKNNDILEKHFYTSIDLKMADMLNLKKELIIDNNINCILYPRSHCLTGFEIFNKFTETLKPLKEDKVEGAKLLLNILSGALSEKNIKTFYIDDKKDNFIDLDDLNLKLLKSSMSIDKTTSIYKCVSSDRFYCSQFARFKPFLLANARLVMLKIILPVNDKVKKVYIDSIITTEPLEYFNEWGKLKVEYSNKQIKIVNNRKELILN